VDKSLSKGEFGFDISGKTTESVVAPSMHTRWLLWETDAAGMDRSAVNHGAQFGEAEALSLPPADGLTLMP
jgi:hypothetical protein